MIDTLLAVAVAGGDFDIAWLLIAHGTSENVYSGAWAGKAEEFARENGRHAISFVF